MKYAILIKPKHFKTYNTQAEKICLSEFCLHNQNLNEFAKNIKLENFGGLCYLTFDAQNLNDEINKKISKLSFVLGLFELNNENKNCLLNPIDKKFEYFVNSNISSLMKYSGKTNEDFTRLMLSVALASLKNQDLNKEEQKNNIEILNNNTNKKENKEKENINNFDFESINILDPICGKGTSLFEGLAHGLNCYGVEIAPKVVEESATYLKKFLENDRLKFNYKKEKFSGAGKSFKAEKFVFAISKTKENKNPKHFEIVSGNTIYADKYFKKQSIDIIIGDLPYGVKHSNITNEKQNSFTRSPEMLLKESLPVWKKVLKEEGVLVISWNTFLLKKEEFCKILKENNFEVLNNEMYNSFEHRVDQAINRDFIVAINK